MALCEKCRQREAMSPERQRCLETHHRGWSGDIESHKIAAKKGWETIRANKLRQKQEEKKAIEHVRRLEAIETAKLREAMRVDKLRLRREEKEAIEHVRRLEAIETARLREAMRVDKLRLRREEREAIESAELEEVMRSAERLARRK